MEKLLSISVAAYNIEQYIEQNIKSFTDATEREYIEVLVTDDGSSDNTTEIVRKYEEQYPGVIKLIRQENQGPGSTVNSGIRNATGKYFKMVDGDDWVNTDQLDILIQKLKNIDVDMIATNYQRYDDLKKEIFLTNKPNLEVDKILNFKEICAGKHLDMHNCIYKTSILKDNNIKLDNCFYTDMEYLLLPSIYVDTIIYYDLNIYVYRVAREGQSISFSSYQKHIDMHKLVLQRLISLYEENKLEMNDNVKQYISEKVSNMACDTLAILLSFDMNAQRKEDIKEFNKNLKKSSKDIYRKYMKKGKRQKILVYSNYVLTDWIAKRAYKHMEKQ